MNLDEVLAHPCVRYKSGQLRDYQEVCEVRQSKEVFSSFVLSSFNLSKLLKDHKTESDFPIDKLNKGRTNQEKTSFLWVLVQFSSREWLRNRLLNIVISLNHFDQLNV